MFIHGGSLISQGGYGCVYYPSLDCEGKETKDASRVTKIQNSKQEAQNELNIGRVIQSSINRFENHFAPLDSSCNPLTLKQLQPSGILQHCKLRISDEYFITHSRHVPGYTLYTYISTIREPSFVMLKVIEIYRHILSSIEKLQSINVVHNDLRVYNIMYDIKKNLPIIIDFGVSFFSNEWSGKIRNVIARSYAPMFDTTSPEVHLLSYLTTDSKDNTTGQRTFDKNQVIEKVTTEVIQHIRILHLAFSSSFIEEYERELKSYFAFILKDYQGDVETLYRNHYEDISKTWDTYSFTIVIMEIIRSIFMEQYPQNEFMSTFVHQLFMNIHPDPRKRPGIKDVIYDFKSFITKHKIRDTFVTEVDSMHFKYLDKQLIELLKTEHSMKTKTNRESSP